MFNILLEGHLIKVDLTKCFMDCIEEDKFYRWATYDEMYKLYVNTINSFLEVNNIADCINMVLNNFDESLN